MQLSHTPFFQGLLGCFLGKFISCYSDWYFKFLFLFRVQVPASKTVVNVEIMQCSHSKCCVCWSVLSNVPVIVMIIYFAENEPKFGLSSVSFMLGILFCGHLFKICSGSVPWAFSGSLTPCIFAAAFSDLSQPTRAFFDGEDGMMLFDFSPGDLPKICSLSK